MNRIVKRSFAAATKEKKGADKRYDTIKRIMYGNSTYRRVPFFYAQGREQHEIIERMWCYEKQQEEAELKKNLEQKYTSMRLAVEALEKIDKRLFEEAVKTDSTARFPLSLKVPTDTLPISNYEEKLKESRKIKA